MPIPKEEEEISTDRKYVAPTSEFSQEHPKRHEMGLLDHQLTRVPLGITGLERINIANT